MSENTVTGGRRMRQQKGETNIRDWVGVHDDLLEEVMNRLPLADCFSFGGVCKTWRSVTFRYFDKCDRVVPCLVKRGQNKNQVTSRSCFSIFGNSNLVMDLPEAHGSCVWGSFQDWLFLGRRVDNCVHISLLNPFSNENIMLPPTASTSFYLMVVSKVPSDENCVCMLVGSGGRIAFWTPGTPDWHHTIPTSCILDALYYRGSFYLLGGDNQIFQVNEVEIISLINSGRKLFDTIREVSSIRSRSVNLPIPVKSKYGLWCTRRYLVESCGEILLVCRNFCKDPPQIGITTDFETYRLDLNQMTWWKLEKLDDKILFVGAGCSKSFHVNDLGETLANNIYFINERACSRCTEWETPFNSEVIDGHDWGFFSFKRSNHWPSVFQKSAKTFPAIWLTAPIGWTLKQRRV